jgi:two-component system sensor histidine kinase BaeS
VGFVLVAIAAVLVLAGLTLLHNRTTVGQLASERQQATADAIAETLALSYSSSGGWDAVDQHPAEMIAVQAGASFTVLGADGEQLSLYSSMGAMPEMGMVPTGPERRAEISVDGRVIGSVVLRFTSGDLAQAESHVRDALRGALVIGVLVAVLVAVVVAVVLSRRIVRPLRSLTDTVHRFGGGDAGARAEAPDAPGEIGELARAFDTMADRLAAHEAARRHLAADIAHELRTPLTILQGNCEEIIDGIAPPSVDRFSQMHDDVLRLRRLVDDLGALAAADAALAEHGVAIERCELGSITTRALDALAPTADVHQHTVDRRLGVAEVLGDPARLEQIVANLVTNAVKFTPPGGHLIVEVASDANGRAVLRVADDGPGIPEHDRTHVFERFFRGEQARTTSGTGIGLAVVDQLVRAHGAQIELGRPESGTSVTVTFPAAPRS